jgi:hypothetical protein
MSDQANIRICSNVFPVTTVWTQSLPGCPTIYGGVYEDPRFRAEIRGKTALKRLAEAMLGSRIEERSLRNDLIDSGAIEQWQIDIFWDQQGSGDCVDCPFGARPFGIVRRNGRYLVENRCKKPGCRCY